MERRLRETHLEGEKSASHARREHLVELITGRQLRLIKTAQLVDAGFTHNAIYKRVRARRLFRLHHGVYATHPPPYSRDQRYLAAVLACEPDAFLNGHHSAALQNFGDPPRSLPSVLTATGRGRSRPGITVHHGPLDPRDVRRVNAIPCTSADRVLIDLAPTLAEPDLERMLVAAESLHLIKRPRLAELITERHGRPGIPGLERLLALEPVLTRSELETIFFPVWRAAGIERPLANHAIDVQGRTLTVDLAWPALRMVVEADSQRFHGDWERAEADRERDQLLALAGWLCHRFVRRKIVEEPEASAGRLRLLADARRAELGWADGRGDQAA